MDKIFSKKERYIYGVCFILGVILFFWSSLRNASCGYDCGLFAVNVGPAVIISWLFSLILIGGSLGLTILIFIYRKYINEK